MTITSIYAKVTKIVTFFAYFFIFTHYAHKINPVVIVTMSIDVSFSFFKIC